MNLLNVIEKATVQSDSSITKLVIDKDNSNILIDNKDRRWLATNFKRAHDAGIIDASQERIELTQSMYFKNDQNIHMFKLKESLY